MTRRRRKPRTINLEGGASGSWGPNAPSDPSIWQWADPATAAASAAAQGDIYGNPITPDWVLSSDGQWQSATVPTGTIPTDSRIQVVTGYPDANTDTWRMPLSSAFWAADIGAATDTVSAVSTQIANAGASVANAFGNIGANIVPILIGLAALYFWTQSNRGKQ